jgi:hypothetical protein
MRNKEQIHGFYTKSNTCAYGIILSDCGEQAKIVSSDTVTEWLDVEWFPSENDSEEFEPIIDPNGYNIPLNLVIRADFFAH